MDSGRPQTVIKLVNIPNKDTVLMVSKIIQMVNLTVKIRQKTHSRLPTAISQKTWTMMVSRPHPPTHSPPRLSTGSFPSLGTSMSQPPTEKCPYGSRRGWIKTKIMPSVGLILGRIRASCSENMLTEQIKRTDCRTLSRR